MTPVDVDLIEEIIKVCEELREHKANVKNLAQRRNQLLLEAHQKEMNMTQIMRATGLSRQGMYSILHRQENFTPRPNIAIDPTRPVYPGQDLTVNLNPRDYRLKRVT